MSRPSSPLTFAIILAMLASAQVAEAYTPKFGKYTVTEITDMEYVKRATECYDAFSLNITLGELERLDNLLKHYTPPEKSELALTPVEAVALREYVRERRNYDDSLTVSSLPIIAAAVEKIRQAGQVDFSKLHTFEPDQTPALKNYQMLRKFIPDKDLPTFKQFASNSEHLARTGIRDDYGRALVAYVNMRQTGEGKLTPEALEVVTLASMIYYLQRGMFDEVKPAVASGATAPLTGFDFSDDDVAPKGKAVATKPKQVSKVRKPSQVHEMADVETLKDRGGMLASIAQLNAVGTSLVATFVSFAGMFGVWRATNK